ncbi:hypothetical protein PIB30_079875 [Stylosanthes scabra]|uniref:Transposase MuDR plant domain-containing protein n=1 Tax=Stylosanthes scabra TaxID=79078 RepID=A0ABU6QQY5_9FABA|nr:hypothetical protein [Stylosanthes scabra]
MFASYERILSDQVMHLYVQLLETRTTTPRAGPSHSGLAGDTPMAADPVDVPPEQTGEESESGEEDAGDTDGGSSGTSEDKYVLETPVGTRFLLPAQLLVPDISTMDSHFHTLYFDAIEEERSVDIGGRDDDYNLDGGLELRFRHSIKYHCVFKQSANECPWRIPVTYRVNLGYRELRKFTGPHTCLAPQMSIDHAQLDNVIFGYIMQIIKKNLVVRIEVMRGRLINPFSMVYLVP